MKVGPYEVTGELGRGGMGVVYRGRGPDGVEVAIKVLRAAQGVDSQRFARERRLLGDVGALDGFVPLLAQGDCDEGPFLVMPLLTGGTLAERLAAGPLKIDEAMGLVRTLARALAAAHARGIVHRDLKPGNVLFDDTGAPRIVDLGLGKHFRRDVPGGTRSLSLTAAGEFHGTAGYMPYEQMLDAKRVGPPADVFALGVLLYEALTGAGPFEGDSLPAIVGNVTSGTYTPVRTLRPETPRALAAIVDRALALAPEDRFPDAGALADALEGGASAGGRSRVAVGIAIAAALLVVGAVGLALASGGAPSPPEVEVGDVAPLDSATPPDVAPPRSSTTTTTSTTPAPAPDVAERAPLDPRAAPQVHDVLERPRARLEAILGRYDWKHADAVLALALSQDGALALAAGQDLAIRAWELATGAEAFDVPVTSQIDALVMTRAGLLLSGGPDGHVRAWDVAARALVWAVEPAEGAVRALALTPDGRRALAACASGSTVVIDLEAERAVQTLRAGSPACAVAASPGGQSVAVGTEGAGAVVFDLLLGEVQARVGEGRVRALAYRPDGVLLIGGEDGTVSAWGQDGARRWSTKPLDRAITALAVVGESTEAFVAGASNGAVVEASPTARARPLGEHRRAVTALAITPDGATVVTTCEDNTVAAWDRRSGTARSRVDGPSGWVRSLAVSRDGRRALTTAGNDAGVRVWDLARSREVALLDAGAGATAACAATFMPPDAEGARVRVVVVHVGGWVTLWDLAHPTAPDAIVQLEDAIEVTALAPESDRRVFLACSDGSLRTVDLTRHAQTSFVDVSQSGVTSVTIVAPGGRVLTSDLDGALRLWDPNGSDRVKTWPQGAAVHSATVGAGGRAAVSLRDGTVRLWDLERGVELRPLGKHRSWAFSVALSPDERLAVSGGRDGTILLHDAETGAVVETLALRASADLVTTVAWLPDGSGWLAGMARGVVLRFSLR